MKTSLQFRRILLFCLSVSLWMSAATQTTGVKSTIPKKPLFEMFTSSTCDPCVAANANLDNVLGDNPGEYSLIKYQMNWPSGGDRYYTAQGGDRRDYYGVGSVPCMVVNGEEGPTGNLTQQTFDQYASEYTDVELSVNANIVASGIITVNLAINPAAVHAAGLKAHIVVVEKTTVGNYGNNGETEFHHVLMAMLPGSQGTTLEALTPGNTVQLSETFNMNNTFMEEPTDLAVIAFLQDDNSQEIIQSAMADVEAIGINSYSITFNITNESGNPVSGAQIEMEANAIQYTSSSGQAFYPTAFPRVYTYRIYKSGFELVYDSLTVVDQNIEIEIVMAPPANYLIYEDFESPYLPGDWTSFYTLPNEVYIAWNSSVVLYREIPGGDLRLIAPPVNLSDADKLLIECGYSNEYPATEMVIGTVPEPTASASFTELARFVPKETGFGWVEYDMSGYTGTDKYLAWQYEGPCGWYVIETVKLTSRSVGIDPGFGNSGALTVYPNPAHNQITISSDHPIVQIRLWDAAGALVENIDAGRQFVLQLQNNAHKGLFFVEIVSEKSVEVRKVVFD